jgi:hypothetical protein
MLDAMKVASERTLVDGGLETRSLESELGKVKGRLPRGLDARMTPTLILLNQLRTK